MRKHEFRGRKWSRRWVYGSLWDRGAKGAEIITTEGSKTGFQPVLADTVSEYTGFLDSDKNPIFEGDILKIPLDLGDDVYDVIVQVTWSQEDGGWMLREQNHDDEILDEVIIGDAKVIGNIWDTPELLEVGHEATDE